MPEYFEPVIKGEKTFEIRVNDRGFKKGDYLALNECYEGTYTDRSCVVYVDYIFFGDGGYLPVGMVVMSIKPCEIIKTQESTKNFMEVPPYWLAVPVIEEVNDDG